jgi:CRISPR-associated protein Cmr4
MLARAARDGVLDRTLLPAFPKPAAGQPDATDEKALLAVKGPLAIEGKVVLEEYTFTHTGELPTRLGETLANLLKENDKPADPVWQEVASRLVILSDGMMSFFAQNACEVAQHVRIDDETGTAAGGALFNQENVPGETLFYSVLHATDERTAGKPNDQRRKAEDALKAFGDKLDDQPVFQFGGDASTGLGYCTVKLGGVKGA